MRGGKRLWFVVSADEGMGEVLKSTLRLILLIRRRVYLERIGGLCRLIESIIRV